MGNDWGVALQVLWGYSHTAKPGASQTWLHHCPRPGSFVWSVKENVKKPLYIESLFMDSGAYSLYNIHVRKLGKDVVREMPQGYIEWAKRRQGKEFKLAPPIHRRGQGDFSFYNLKKGSEFRVYCDHFASFMKRMMALGVDKEMFFTTVDVITNPILTWEVQEYFEKQHGLFPIPVIHACTPLEYVGRYIEKADKYPLIGIGGLGQNIAVQDYLRWADQLFTMLCPRTNNFLPIVKTHGFAMTSWKLICRWPWWSVDSATWVKLSAYGWLYVPRWSEEKGWRWDKPPIQINASFRSPFLKVRDKHIDNARPEVQRTVKRWLERVGQVEGSVNKKGEEVVFGIRSNFRSRSVCNLYYLKDLEESRPEWPHPLDPKIVKGHKVTYSEGFGL